MQPNASLWDTLREWLTLAVGFASAIFAGLIWWLASGRLSTVYKLRPDSLTHTGALRMVLEIKNRGDSDIRIENLSTDYPLSIITGDNNMLASASGADSEKRKLSRLIHHPKTIEPDSVYKTNFAIHREGGFNSVKSVSIAVHILKSFPTIRHKKKVLKAILPANIRNSQA
jgi:hypothetical protein